MIRSTEKIDKNQHHYKMTAEDMQSRVLFKDKYIIVVNKPSAITVHPGARGNYSMEQFFEALRYEYREDPKLAHRLDRDTSGCLVLSRRKASRSKLGIMFENKRIKKTYWAVVHGIVEKDKGKIENYIKKEKNEKGWYARTVNKPIEGAKKSITKWKVMHRGDNYTFLELEPLTGRTHQIRVHCAESLGHPIIGDWVYGEQDQEDSDLPLLHLHARSISIPYYHDEKPIFVEAPVPDHMSDKINH